MMSNLLLIFHYISQVRVKLGYSLTDYFIDILFGLPQSARAAVSYAASVSDVSCIDDCNSHVILNIFKLYFKIKIIPSNFNAKHSPLRFIC